MCTNNRETGETQASLVQLPNQQESIGKIGIIETYQSYIYTTLTAQTVHFGQNIRIPHNMCSDSYTRYRPGWLGKLHGHK